jgi:hypothetical protein
MNRLYRRCASMIAALACCALLLMLPMLATASSAARDPASVAKANASMQAALSPARRAAAAGTTRPNDIFANPNRAYPASCLVDGLPFGVFRQSPNDPAPLQQQMILPGDVTTCFGGNNPECTYTEQVTVSVWRVPCSKDSAGNPQSAVLLEIDRPCGGCDNQPLYPTFPLVLATQGNSSLYIRLASDQNTWYSATYASSPIGHSDIWVLENFLGSAVQFDYNQAFSLNLDNHTIDFSVPAYNPAQYAANSFTLPISGYMTSNWFDPQHGGEGILTQIFDNSDGATRTFTAAWYTFDKAGRPFWLYAQGTFQIGATTTGTVDTYYENNGCFAGIGCGSATPTKWGTITFGFPDCGHMSFTFNGNADAVNGPTASGTRTWLRIANVNSIVCD